MQSTPVSSSLPATDSSAKKHQSHTNQPLSDRTRTTKLASTQPYASHRRASRKGSISSMESEADTEFSDRPPVDLHAEEGEVTTRMLPSPTRTKLLLKSKRIGRLCEVFALTWVGPTYQTWIHTLTLLITTPLPAQRLKCLTKCLSRCRLMIGCVGHSTN